MSFKSNLLGSFDNKVGNIVNTKFRFFLSKHGFFVQNQFGNAKLIRIMPLSEKGYTHDLYRLNIL